MQRLCPAPVTSYNNGLMQRTNDYKLCTEKSTSMNIMMCTTLFYYNIIYYEGTYKVYTI